MIVLLGVVVLFLVVVVLILLLLLLLLLLPLLLGLSSLLLLLLVLLLLLLLPPQAGALGGGGGGGGGKGPGEVSETNPSTAAPGANLKVPQGERPESDHLSLKNWRATIPTYPRTGGLSLLGMANGANHPVQHGSMAQSEGIDLPEG